jgi:surface antigen
MAVLAQCAVWRDIRAKLLSSDGGASTPPDAEAECAGMNEVPARPPKGGATRKTPAARHEKHTANISSSSSFALRRQTLRCERDRASGALIAFFGGFPVLLLARAGFAIAVLATLSGCASSSGETPPPAAAVAVPYVGLASGSLGANLNPTDKTAANKAELAALASGERKTWRGDDGSYGYVAPAPGAGDCRDITHTVYINGRPQVAKGTACRAGDGWKLNG